MERSSRRFAEFAFFWQAPQHGYWRELLHRRSLHVFLVGELAVAIEPVVAVLVVVLPVTVQPAAAVPVVATPLMSAEAERR
jgi:uncharacterized metal-binding protein